MPRIDDQIKSVISCYDVFATEFPDHYKREGESRCPWCGDTALEVAERYVRCPARCAGKRNRGIYDVFDLIIKARGLTHIQARNHLAAELGVGIEGKKRGPKSKVAVQQQVQEKPDADPPAQVVDVPATKKVQEAADDDSEDLSPTQPKTDSGLVANFFSKIKEAFAKLEGMPGRLFLGLFTMVPTPVSERLIGLHSHLSVWMAIENRCIKNAYSYPSIKLICKMTGLGKDRVLDIIQELEWLGCLKAKHQRRRGNRYWPMVPFGHKWCEAAKFKGNVHELADAHKWTRDHLLSGVESTYSTGISGVESTRSKDIYKRITKHITHLFAIRSEAGAVSESVNEWEKDAVVGDILKSWDCLYRQRYARRYEVKKKCIATIKTLVGSPNYMEPDALRKYLHRYIEDDNPWLEEREHNIRHFRPARYMMDDATYEQEQRMKRLAKSLVAFFSAKYREIIREPYVDLDDEVIKMEAVLKWLEEHGEPSNKAEVERRIVAFLHDPLDWQRQTGDYGTNHSIGVFLHQIKYARYAHGESAATKKPVFYRTDTGRLNYEPSGRDDDE